MSMMFIKISIASMLLRIKHTRPWRIFLWAMVAVQILSCLASLIFQLVQCIPLGYMWDPVHHPDAECVELQSMYVSLYVNSGISITTDLIFALVPISFIRTMHCPLREKLVLSCLMGLGVFAAAASIVKTTLVKDYGSTGDSLWDAIDLTLWSVLEEQTGIIAACIPCLKSPFERTLHRLGVLSSTKRPSYGYTGDGRRHDAHQLPPLHLSRHAFGVGLSIDTPLSTTLTGKSTKSTIGRSTDTQSEETIWPNSTHATRGSEEGRRERDEAFRQMMAEGGILMTTEFQIKSEVMSRVGSPAGELETGQREIEDWRVERPSFDAGPRRWDAV